MRFLSLTDHSSELKLQPGAAAARSPRSCLVFPSIAVALLLGMLAPAAAQIQSRSHSGQFIVQTVPRPAQRSRYLSSFETNRNYITLDATLLPVSCERVKQVLWRRLGVNGQWSGRVFLALYNAGSGNEPVTITSAQFRDGWQYRIELPDLLERAEYVRAIVQALLLEIANRAAHEKSAEIPGWLTEGFAQELLASNEIEIILPPPRPGSGGLQLATTIVNARKISPLEHAHDVLRLNPPLSFQQLSWPAPEQLEEPAAEIYRGSAQLLVNELLSLEGGPACLQAMLAELPRHYNWQFAFLSAFQRHFQRPLEVEKWWALRVEHFTGRDLAQTWPPEESWDQFDQLIHSAVQIYASNTELPLRSEVNLQTIVKDWDRQKQTDALQAKVRQFEQLRLRLAPAFVPLAVEYHRTLATYLVERDQSFLPFRKKAARRHAADEAIKELNRLDAALAALRPLSMPVKATQAKAN